MMKTTITWLWLPILGLLFTASAMGKEKPDPNIPTPQAQELINQVKAAYADLKSLRMDGKLSADINVGGQKDDRTVEFLAQFKAPTQYRHEIKGKLLTGSTGKKMYIHEQSQNVYILFDAPAEKTGYRQLPGITGQVLEVQDPGLLLAVSANSVQDLIADAKKVHIPEPTTQPANLSILAYTAGDGREVQLTFDPQSHLLTQAKFDLATMMRNRGAEQVESAVITIDYSALKANEDLDDAIFAWAPPANAREVPASSGGDENGDHLVGKPAPDFDLKGLDGQSVKLSSLKGKVVLLDFWATWCPPCVRSLPEINQLYHSKKGSGVEVFAVNVGEELPLVKKFLDSKKLDLPVLLDTDEAAFESLGINSIPTTVIVNSEGIVHKVFVGIPPGGKAELERELDAAAKPAKD